MSPNDKPAGRRNSRANRRRSEARSRSLGLAFRPEGVDGPGIVELERRALLAIGAPSLVVADSTTLAAKASLSVTPTAALAAGGASGETVFVVVALEAATLPAASSVTVSDSSSGANGYSQDAVAVAPQNAHLSLLIFSSHLSASLTTSSTITVNFASAFSGQIAVDVSAADGLYSPTSGSSAVRIGTGSGKSDATTGAADATVMTGQDAPHKSNPTDDELAVGAIAVGEDTSGLAGADALVGDASYATITAPGTLSNLSTLIQDKVYLGTSPQGDVTADGGFVDPSNPSVPWTSALVTYAAQAPKVADFSGDPNGTFSVNLGSTLTVGAANGPKGHTTFYGPTAGTTESYSESNGPANGLTFSAADGSFSFAPTDASKPGTFDYQAEETEPATNPTGSLTSGDGTVTIAVTNTAPAVSPSSSSTTPIMVDPNATTSNSPVILLTPVGAADSDLSTPDFQIPAASVAGGAIWYDVNGTYQQATASAVDGNFYIPIAAIGSSTGAKVKFVPTANLYTGDANGDTFGFQVADSSTDGSTTPTVSQARQVYIDVEPAAPVVPSTAPTPSTIAARAGVASSVFSVTPAPGDSAGQIAVTAVTDGSLSFTADGGDTRTTTITQASINAATNKYILLSPTEAATLRFTSASDLDTAALVDAAAGHFSFSVEAAQTVAGSVAVGPAVTDSAITITPPSTPNVPSSVAARALAPSPSFSVTPASGDVSPTGYVNGIAVTAVSDGSLSFTPDPTDSQATTITAATIAASPGGYILLSISEAATLRFTSASNLDTVALVAGAAGDFSFTVEAAATYNGNTVVSDAVVDSNITVTPPSTPTVPASIAERALAPSATFSVSPASGDVSPTSYVTGIAVTAVSDGTLSFTPDGGDTQATTITAATIAASANKYILLSPTEATTLKFTSASDLDTAALVDAAAGHFSFAVEAVATYNGTTIVSNPTTESNITVTPPGSPAVPASVGSDEDGTTGTVLITPSKADAGYVNGIDVTAVGQGSLSFTPDAGDAQATTITAATIAASPDGYIALSTTEAQTLVFTPTSTYDLTGADSGKLGSYSFAVQTSATVPGVGTVTGTPVTVPVSVVPVSDLSVTITPSTTASLTVGENFSYTVTVKNNGPSTAEGVMLTVALPTTVTALPGNPVAFNLGAIPPTGAGSTVTETIKVVVNPSAAAGTVQASASVTLTGPGSGGSLNHGTGSGMSPTNPVSGTFLVENSLDPTAAGDPNYSTDYPLSLRGIIAAADSPATASEPMVTIEFAPGLGPIDLTSGIEITRPIQLLGPGGSQPSVTINGTAIGSGSILTIGPGSDTAAGYTTIQGIEFDATSPVAAIEVDDTSTGATTPKILGDVIRGTGLTATSSDVGIKLDAGSSGALIANDTISGLAAGIDVSSSNNTIQANLIGTLFPSSSSLGNLNGIVIHTGADDNVIGAGNAEVDYGAAQPLGNIIAFNGVQADGSAFLSGSTLGNGILIDSSTPPTSTEIRGNSIYQNGAPPVPSTVPPPYGIDRAVASSTPTPSLQGAVLLNNKLTIQGTLALPSGQTGTVTYLIDFYTQNVTNPRQADGSPNTTSSPEPLSPTPQGQTYLGSYQATVSAASPTFDFSSLPASLVSELAVNQFITATATPTGTGSGFVGDTSPFSEPVIISNGLEVVTTADNGDNTNPTPGSLRQAIMIANGEAPNITSFIVFQLPSGQTTIPSVATVATGGVTTYVPLPKITGNVSIDGYTQFGAIPGAAGSATILVTIDGTDQTTGAGLDVAGGSSLIEGLRFVNFGAGVPAVEVEGGSGSQVSGDAFGFLATGAAPDAGPGIEVDASTHTVSSLVVGGPGLDDQDEFAGNLQAILVEGPNTSAITIQGNLIDSRPGAGNAIGVELDGASRVNVLGNTIDGATIAGIEVTSLVPPASGTVDATVGVGNVAISGNLIGTDPTGLSTSAGSGNSIGIDLADLIAQAIVSTSVLVQDNVVGGNSTGILLDDANSATINANEIGVGADGSTDVGNSGDGIRIEGANSTVNAVAGSSGLVLTTNIVGDNGTNGIEVDGAYVSGVRIQNNGIGTGTVGLGTLGNMGDGILIDGLAYAKATGAGAAGILLINDEVQGVIAGSNAVGTGREGIVIDQSTGVLPAGAIPVAVSISGGSISGLAGSGLEILDGSDVSASGVSIASTAGPAVEVSGGSGVVLSGFVIVQGQGGGILVTGGASSASIANATVTDTVTNNSAYAIRVEDGKTATTTGTTISGGTLSGFAVGIQVAGGSSTSIGGVAITVPEDGDGIDVGGTAAGTTISGGTITGGTASSSSSSVGIRVDGGTGTSVAGTAIDYLGSAGILVDGSRASVVDVAIAQSKLLGIGIALDDGTTGVSIRGATIAGGSVGIADSYGATDTISGGSISGTSDEAIELLGTTFDAVSNVMIGGVGGYGIQVQGATSSTVSGNSIISPTAANSAGEDGILVDDSPSTTVNGNVITRAGQYGIEVEGATSTSAMILYNFVGTNPVGQPGQADLGNALFGIYAHDLSATTTGPEITIQGNVIETDRTLLNTSDELGGIELKSIGRASVTLNRVGTDFGGTETFEDSGVGLFITGVSVATIEDNILANSQTGDGLDADGVGATSFDIESNVIEANKGGDGLSIGSTGLAHSSFTIKNNVIESNGTVVSGESDGLYLQGTGASSVAISGNTIESNKGDGLGVDATYAGPSTFAIQGNAVGSNALDGLDFVGNPSASLTVSGNSFTASGRVGASLRSAPGAKFEYNYVGTTASNALGAGNEGDGLDLDATPGALVLGNVVAGNAKVGLLVHGSTGVTVDGNDIGALNSPADANNHFDGALSLGNLGGGLEVEDSSATLVESNTISNNTGFGVVSLLSPSPLPLAAGDPTTASTLTISGNHIGTDGSGELARGNAGAGVELLGTSGTLAGNVISANAGDGVYIAASRGAQVSRNVIGTDAGLTKALGNSGDGVHLFDTVGVAIVANTVAASGASGIEVDGTGSGDKSATEVESNLVGISPTGASGLGNGSRGGAAGISIVAANNVTVAQDSIASNFGDGLDDSGGSGLTLQVDWIGTNSKGAANLGNGGSGVSISGAGATGVRVLGDAIAGNVKDGLVASAVSGLTVSGNYLGAFGATPLGNQEDDLELSSVTGSSQVLGNYIVDAGLDGVAIVGGSSGIALDGNSIGVLSNGGAGGNKLDGVLIDAPSPTGANSGIVLEAGTDSSNGSDGVQIETTVGVFVAIPTIDSNKLDGVQIQGSARTRIAGATVDRNQGDGILAEGSTGTAISSSTVDQNASYGVELSTSTSSSVASSRVDANGSAGVGILASSSGNSVSGSTIGGAVGNGGDGVMISSSTGNSVAGSTIAANKQVGVLVIAALGAGNAISSDAIDGNGGDGVDVQDSIGTLVSGDLIGADYAGDNLGNHAYGVAIELYSNKTMVSSDLVAANQNSGVLVTNSAFANTLGGDTIGLVHGTTNLGNRGDGVTLLNAGSGNSISGSTIVANANNGILVSGGQPGTIIAGDFIGTDARGDALGNRNYGLFINGTDGTAVRGGTRIDDNASHGAVISAGAGNTLSGVAIEGNKLDGVLLTDNSSGNAIGVLGAGDTISGNAADGVGIFGGSGNRVQGDVIGRSGLPNAGDGVHVISSTGNTIGGASAGLGDSVSANAQSGVELSGTSTGNLVLGDTIGSTSDGGTDGNRLDGVLIDGSSGANPTTPTNNSIGATVAGKGVGNTIRGNQLYGIAVDLADDNSIVANSVRSNNLDGIDIFSNSTGNQITGGNTIADNRGDGVDLVSATSTGIGGDAIQGNLVDGVAVDGSTGTVLSSDSITGNHQDGVRVEDSSEQNQIGVVGTFPNTILDNSGAGVEISTNSTYNALYNNFIGYFGGSGQGNAIGVYLNQVDHNYVGSGSVDSGANMITGNTVAGVEIAGNSSDPAGDQVAGNYIGTDPNGNAPLSFPTEPGLGDVGVLVSNSQRDAIASNVVSGNHQAGIELFGVGSTGDLIEGNVVGSNRAMTAPILTNPAAGPNFYSIPDSTTPYLGTRQNYGIWIDGASSDGTNNPADTVSSNIVLGNEVGIQVDGGTAQHDVIEANTVGRPVGSYAEGSPNVGGLANYYGIFANGTSNDQFLGNQVDRNLSVGIDLEGPSAVDNTLQGNTIDSNGGYAEMSADGSYVVTVPITVGALVFGSGVYIDSGQGNTVNANTIDDNTQVGVYIYNFGTLTSTPQNEITNNTILGVDHGNGPWDGDYGVLLFDSSGNIPGVPQVGAGTNDDSGNRIAQFREYTGPGSVEPATVQPGTQGLGSTSNAMADALTIGASTPKPPSSSFKA